MKYINIITSFLLLLGLSSCQEEAPDDMVQGAILTLDLSHLVNGEQLLFNTQTYTNASGESFVVQDFKYYLSNIKLRNTSTGAFYLEPYSYHLVRPVEGEAFQIQIDNIPAGAYNEVEFAIGVDNAANTSTDKVGALDPSNEMAWDWNTGYKFLLMEGQFGESEDNMNDAFVYHIGGDPNYRVLKFSLSQLGLSTLNLENNSTQSLAIEADVAAIFAGPNAVSFAEYPVVMHDPFSQSVADNYAAHMFEITAVE
ncbi:MbnP family protein [Catalinimonas sp. 4WD22]|uniref:MbnP family protein n=1 Tax=Catalinimonas locisalis TaxID=3133978 RepID=UPI003100F282